MPRDADALIAQQISSINERLADLTRFDGPVTEGYPALSGLTAGQVLRATSATAAAFGAVDLADSDAITGVMPVSYLGTTQSPTFGGLTISHATGASTLNIFGATSGQNSIIELGAGGSGNRYAYVDFVGDATYTDYGLRVVRNNGGANTSSEIVHRGTGELLLNAQDASGTIRLQATNWVSATSWTPTWTGTGSNPAIGNGTQAHYYVRSGDVCHIWGNITMGSTTTYGTGTYEFTVPVAAINNPRFYIGSAQLLDTGVADYIGQVRHDASTGKFRIITPTGSVGQTVPHTWGNTDVIAYALSYRVN